MITNTTGSRLKSLREKRGWSQADVAERIGVGRTTYLKYETGENKPVRKLHELARLFGVSYDYLLAYDYILDNDKSTGEILTDEETKLLYVYRRLSPERKRLVRDMMREFGKLPSSGVTQNTNIVDVGSSGFQGV